MLKVKSKSFSIINCICPKLIVKTAEQSTLDVASVNLKHMQDIDLMIL